jgi:hypothetical protein
MKFVRNRKVKCKKVILQSVGCCAFTVALSEMKGRVTISGPTCTENQVLSKTLRLEVEELLSRSAAAADSFHIGF